MSDIGLSDDVSTADAQSAGLGGPNQSDSIDADIGTGRTDNRTNISNVGQGSNLTYSPTFAAEVAISQGLNPYNSVKGFTGLGLPADSPYGPDSPAAVQAALMGRTLNTDQKNSNLQALALAKNNPLTSQIQTLRGANLTNYAKSMKGNMLSLDPLDFDKMDVNQKADIFSSLGMDIDNPYGIAGIEASQGYISDALGFLGVKDTSPNYSQAAMGSRFGLSKENVADVARGMIGYAATPGTNITSYGNFGAISDQFSKDMSNIASEIRGGKISRDFSNLGKSLSSALDGGISYLFNPFAGKGIEQTIQETVDAFGNRVDPNAVNPLSATGAVDAFGTPVSRAEQRREANLGFGLGSMMTDPSFMGRPIDTVTKTSLDKLVDRPSIAQLAEDRKKQNALNSIFDMLNKDTQNIEIAAGANTGKKLNTALPERRDLNAFTSPGFLQSSVNPIIKENPMQGPPSPFFPDQITPTKRPFATTDEVALRSSPEGFYFANAFNRPLDASRTSEKYRTPINEEEARAEEFAAYNLSSIPKGTDPVEFINKRDLPSDLQGIVSLNRDLDYGSTIPLSYYFDQTARGKAEERARLETIRKAAEALANQPRLYPDSGTDGLPGLY